MADSFDLWKGEGERQPVPEIIRSLAKAANAPKRSGKSKTIFSDAGKPLLEIDAIGRKGIKLTVLTQGCGEREVAETALRALLDQYWSE